MITYFAIGADCESQLYSRSCVIRCHGTSHILFCNLEEYSDIRILTKTVALENQTEQSKKRLHLST